MSGDPQVGNPAAESSKSEVTASKEREKAEEATDSPEQAPEHLLSQATNQDAASDQSIEKQSDAHSEIKEDKEVMQTPARLKAAVSRSTPSDLHTGA